MNRISVSKNLTKKISIFFFVFFIFNYVSLIKTDARIKDFADGADITKCVTDNKCYVFGDLSDILLKNNNYKFANTDKNLNGTLNNSDYKKSDFTLSLDQVINERLYRAGYGYFGGNSFYDNFSSIDNKINALGGTTLSDTDRQQLGLLLVTLGTASQSESQKFYIAKYVTTSLANSSSIFEYKDSQIATNMYYFLEIYKILDKYSSINKTILSTSNQTDLTNIKNDLAKTILSNLYKTNSIVKADNCNSDGSNFQNCLLFSSGKFTVNSNSFSGPNLTFDVNSDVDKLKLDAVNNDVNANSTTTPFATTTVDDAYKYTRNDYGISTCPKDISFSMFISGAIPLVGKTLPLSCSLGAYLINTIIQGINGLVNIIVNLAGSLFDWIYNIGVINFKDWVDNSGAYTIYKTIILSLIISAMFFFVTYLIFMSLFNDDMEKFKKIIPGLILTTLFVYFSFTITGWIIDQSNIITIYLYRSMTHQTGSVQTIGEVFKRILNLNNGGVGSGDIGDNFGISIGTWDAIPFTVGQLVVSIVGVFVLFEGAILILSRTIILLLCMIFSPIMLLPEGLTEFTDKYKKLVMDNFTGNVMLGPVFMFLVLIAVQIGQLTTKMVGAGPTIPAGAPANTAGFLGGIISSVLVIVVLQLAISASKSLSGSMGEKLSGVISKYAGGAAFGGGAKILRNTIGRGAAIAKDKGWMMGKEGSSRHKFMSTLYNGAAKSTFDARNTDTFKSAADFSGAGANSFGQGSSKNYNDSFKAKLYDANKYHSGLDARGKQRNINRLKSLGGMGDIDSKRIAESLEKKWKPSINERLNNDSDYNKKFDKAQNEKDEGKRKTETEKVINEHFKENGLGGEYFSKEMGKPENNKIKGEYDKALSEKDPIKRKETLTKVIVDLDKKTNPDEDSLIKSLEQTKIQNVNSNSESDHQEIVEEKDNTLRTTPPRLLNHQLEKIEETSSGIRHQNLMNSFTNSGKKMNEQMEQIVEEEQNKINTTPTAQDLNAQTSLKDRLKEKWTPEKIKNSIDGRNQRNNDKAVAKSIEKNKSKQGNNNDKPDDDKPTTPSPSDSQRPEISNSMSVNETGKLRPMYSPEEIATLNKNRESGGEGDKKVA